MPIQDGVLIACKSGVVELTATIAWENYRARFDHAFGIEAEGFSAGAYCALPVAAQEN